MCAALTARVTSSTRSSRRLESAAPLFSWSRSESSWWPEQHRVIITDRPSTGFHYNTANTNNTNNNNNNANNNKNKNNKNNKNKNKSIC